MPKVSRDESKMPLQEAAPTPMDAEEAADTLPSKPAFEALTTTDAAGGKVELRRVRKGGGRSAKGARGDVLGLFGWCRWLTTVNAATKDMYECVPFVRPGVSPFAIITQLIIRTFLINHVLKNCLPVEARWIRICNTRSFAGASWSHVCKHGVISLPPTHYCMHHRCLCHNIA